MVKSRKSQRNNNDIRVHDFVLSGAPLKRALPFFASPTLWRLFATMLAQACERYLDRERSVLECSTSGQCGFASSSAPTTLSDRSDAIAAEPPLIEWRVVLGIRDGSYRHAANAAVPAIVAALKDCRAFCSPVK